MTENTFKQEVEKTVGREISEEEFQNALLYAGNKQKYIYSREHRPVIMQEWYLVQLTSEYVISLAFSKLTQDICNILHNMEKEHPVEDQDALVANPIVAV